jgi:hypothetical protein
VGRQSFADAQPKYPTVDLVTCANLPSALKPSKLQSFGGRSCAAAAMQITTESKA